ncbi:MAG: hypothetical protein H6620_12755 [Halobacteriovoraceae bacterium]|nr:hypothetical protein [Halobacteriovoraceae bacterium]
MEKKQAANIVLNENLFLSAQLSKALEVLLEFNLTTNEKVDIVKRINCSATPSELDDTMRLIKKELSKSYMDPESGEKWSVGFIEEILKHHSGKLGFDPISQIRESFDAIGLLKDYQFDALSQEEIDKEKLIQQVKIFKEMQKELNSNFEAINEVFEKISEE